MENPKELTLEEKRKLFLKSIKRLEKKYGVELTFGWINSCDDDGIILKDSETDEEIYL